MRTPAPCSGHGLRADQPADIAQAHPACIALFTRGATDTDRHPAGFGGAGDLFHRRQFAVGEDVFVDPGVDRPGDFVADRVDEGKALRLENVCDPFEDRCDLGIAHVFDHADRGNLVVKAVRFAGVLQADLDLVGEATLGDLLNRIVALFCRNGELSFYLNRNSFRNYFCLVSSQFYFALKIIVGVEGLLFSSFYPILKGSQSSIPEIKSLHG